MPNHYLFTGKDGKTRAFIGDRPPTDDEQAQIEAADAVAPPPTTGDMLSRSGMSLTPTPEGAGPSGPSLLDRLTAMMAPYAHPQTVADVGGLIAAPVDAPRRALATTAALSASRGPASTTATTVGKGLEALGNSKAATAAERYGPLDFILRGDPKGAIAAGAPSLLRMSGRGLQSLGSAIAPEAQAAGEAAPAAAPAAPAIDPATRARLVSQGYSPELLQRIEQAAQNQPKPPVMARPPIAVKPSSPMQPPPASAPSAPGLPASWKPFAQPRAAAPAPAPSNVTPGQPVPLFGGPGGVKGVTSNNLEQASNAALAAGHWDEAERLIGQSLNAFFQGSGGPTAAVLAAAIAHKARAAVEPLRANPAFQAAPPQVQQQLIQRALRQPQARTTLQQALSGQGS